MSGSVSCKCETNGEGTSNASTTTSAYGEVAACESVFFSPVTWIVNVWLLLVRFRALKTGTWISYDLANISTWETKTPCKPTVIPNPAGTEAHGRIGFLVAVYRGWWRRCIGHRDGDWRRSSLVAG